jgi:hypothetical protein
MITVIVDKLTDVPLLLKTIKEPLPRTEVKGIICSASRREAVLAELRSRPERQFIVLLCVI